MSEIGEITKLLEELAREGGSGPSSALERLRALVYEELRALARANRYRWQGPANFKHQRFLIEHQ